MNDINSLADPGASTISHNIGIVQLFGLIVETMPRTCLQCLRGKKRLQRFTNLNSGHLEALLLSMALQHCPKIFTMDMQQVLGSCSLVEIVSSAKLSSSLYANWYTASLLRRNLTVSPCLCTSTSFSTSF